MTENALKPYVIGLDLGGTNSVFGIVDARGEIKATTAIKTGGYDNVNDYVKAAVEALQPIIETVGGIEKIKAMGIGAPNGNFYKGTIEFAPNLPWAHTCVVPLADLFSKALGGLPVALTNDANAAALGEMTYGVARGMKNFIDITLGTGVGSRHRDRWKDGLWMRWFRWRAGPCGNGSWQGRPYTAAAAELAVWRLTALQQVWLVLHANSSRRAMSLHCSAKSSQRTSPLTR